MLTTESPSNLIRIFADHRWSGYIDYQGMLDIANAERVEPWRRRFFRIQFFFRYSNQHSLFDFINQPGVYKWFVPESIYVPRYGGNYPLQRESYSSTIVSLGIKVPGLSLLAKSESFITLATELSINEVNFRELFQKRKSPTPQADKIIDVGACEIWGDEYEQRKLIWRDGQLAEILSS